MEELGSDAARYHRELGAKLRLRAGDFVYLIGGHAESIRDGALASGMNVSQIELASSIESIASGVSGFHGSVFIKGSRRYQLERSVEGIGMEAAHA